MIFASHFFILAVLCTVQILCSSTDAETLSGSSCKRLRNLQEEEEHTYSQYGEDGVLIALLDIIGIEESSR